MSDLPGDLLYTEEHEWLRREEDGSVTIGITDHAQSALGDLVYVELPEVGRMSIRPAKWRLSSPSKRHLMYTRRSAATSLPLTKTLADDPEKINTEPYGDGWIVRIQPSDAYRRR